MNPTFENNSSPIVIGGIGGSGTRLIAEVCRDLGVNIGSCLNSSLDNLWFTLLMKRPTWFNEFPAEEQVVDAILLLRRAMTEGLASNATVDETRFVQDLGAEHAHSPVQTGAGETISANILESSQPQFGSQGLWGWKEPNTHIFLPQLASTLPNMRFIHVIRNGLDMAFSNNQQQARNWGNYICGDRFESNDISKDASLTYWVEANNRAVQLGARLLEDRFYLLNYDAFCADPLPQLERLCAFLNIQVEQTIIDACAGKVAPISLGRHKDYEGPKFSQAQINAVRGFGFDI